MGNKYYGLNNDNNKDNKSKIPDWMDSVIEKTNESDKNRKNYNLVEKSNKDVKDKVPDWMDSIFEKKEKPKEIEKPPEKKVKKCSSCGATLSGGEIGTCGKCSNL